MTKAEDDFYTEHDEIRWAFQKERSELKMSNAPQISFFYLGIKYGLLFERVFRKHGKDINQFPQ